MLDASQIFTLFVLTLGPIKILGPFVQQTRDLDGSAMRGLALRVFAMSVVVVLVAALLGSAVLSKWGISLPALLIAIGIVFFLVAIRTVLAQYDDDLAERPALPKDPWAASLRLTFPTVLTPYGMAAVIALIAATDDPARVRMILILAVVAMTLNLLAMLFARKIMQGVALLILRILGAILGMLQVALSVQIVIWALEELGVVTV